MAKQRSTSKSQVKDFLVLSRILTGFENLDEEVGERYLARLANSSFAEPLREVLLRFHALGKEADAAQVKEKILADDKLRPTICQIILLWYTSGMQDKPDDPKAATSMRYGAPEDYFSGLGWQVIGAHVPGLSGGYFGHWRYRPDNEPSEAENEA